MVVLAVVNQKGGVGKTTVALALAATAVVRGVPTVVVDLDPQGNATTGLGVWNPPSTVDTALEVERPGSINDLLVPAGWDDIALGGVPLVAAASPRLAVRESQLATDPIGAQDRLRIALEGLDADLVIIDCPPSLGLLTVNALFAADLVAIVTEPAAWSTDGVQQILRNIDRVAARRGGSPELAGIVVNRLPRTRDARYWHEHLMGTHGDVVIDPPIRLRAAIAEAAAAATPVHALHRDGVDEALAEFGAVFDALLSARLPIPVLRRRA